MAVPVFFTVNVCDVTAFTLVVPKSVPSAASGVLSPSAMLLEFPSTSISGVPDTLTFAMMVKL